MWLTPVTVTSFLPSPQNYLCCVVFCFGRVLNAHIVQNLWKQKECFQKEQKRVRFLMVYRGVLLHPEINLQQSSASWLQQRWKEKVISYSNRQRVRLPRLPIPPTKETNICNLSYYLPNIMRWTWAILIYESWLI